VSDKDVQILMELAEAKLEQLKDLSKNDVILLFNDAGILTKKGKFTKAYAELEELVNPE